MQTNKSGNNYIEVRMKLWHTRFLIGIIQYGKDSQYFRGWIFYIRKKSWIQRYGVASPVCRINIRRNR